MIPLSLIALLTETPGDVDWSPTFVLVLVGLALPGTAIAYWLWLSALETLALNRANAFSVLVPIFGLSLGIAFYGEDLTVSIALGASLALVGIVLVTRPSRTDPTLNPEATSSPALDATAA